MEAGPLAAIKMGSQYFSYLSTSFCTPHPACSICLKVKVKSLSCVQLFATPWTVAYQASPSMGFSRQECWSGLPFPFPGDLPDPEIEPGLPHCRQTLYRLSHQGIKGGTTKEQLDESERGE